MHQHLAAIVCGIPFSGTTYLSRLICAHPKIDSGFECGLLFGDSPAEFPERQNHYEWMMSLTPPYNWKLTQEQMDEVCASKSFDEAYRTIMSHCHLFHGSKTLILDKTPAYIYKLHKIMNKAPGVPIIAVVKDKFSQYYSFKKRQRSLEFFIDRYTLAHKALDIVRNSNKLQSQLLVLDFDELVSQPEHSYKKIIEFIGLFNKEVVYESEQLSGMSKSMKDDMKGQKKLRKNFSFEDEKKRMMKKLSSQELDALESIVL